jgi:hypothetical protein
METEDKVNGSGLGGDGSKRPKQPVTWIIPPDSQSERIIPRHPAPNKYWVVVGTYIKDFPTQADAEAHAIIAARNYPGQTIRVTKTIKAYRTKDPAVETLESE